MSGKEGGLGDGLLVGGYDLSGDVGSVDMLSGGPATLLDVTAINKKAHERIGGQRIGDIQFTSFFNPSSGQSHPVLSALPTADVIATYLHGSIAGNVSACCSGKQVNYDPTRDTTGNLTVKVDVQANGFGLDWGNQVTAGAQSFSNAFSGDESTFEAGIGTWASNVGSVTLASSASQAHSGSKSLSVTSSTSGTMSVKHIGTPTSGLAVTPGQQVHLEGWIRTASSARTVQAYVNWYTSGGSSISTSTGTGVADASGAWAICTATLTAPATAAFAIAGFQWLSVGGASEVHYLDDVVAIVLPAPLDTGIGSLFTGDSSTFEGGIANWAAVTNATIAQSASQAHTGTESLAVTSAASGDMTAASCAAASILTQGFAVTAGQAYNAGAWFFAAANARTVSVGVDWYDSAGNSLSTSFGTGASDSTSTWTNVTALVTAPATAAYARVIVKVASTGGSSEVHYVDDVVCYPACGAQAYLQVTSFTGTDATFKVQDSADNVTFADVSGLGFTQASAAPASQRLAIANGTVLRRYVNLSVATTAGWTAATACLVITKNTVGVSF